MCAGRSLNQLTGNTHPPAGLSDASFQHVAHAKLPPDLFDVDRVSLVREARIPGDYEQGVEARQCGDDVLDHAVGEVFLLGIAAHVLERQDGDGRFVRQRRLLGGFGSYGRTGAGGGVQSQSVGPDRLGNVLELSFAPILQRGVELALDLVVDLGGNEDPARVGKPLEPGGDVDAFTVEVPIPLDDDVPQIEPDPEPNAVW